MRSGGAQGIRGSDPPTRLRRDGSAYGQEKLRVAGNWWRVCGGKFVGFLGIAKGLRGWEDGELDFR